MKSHKGNNYKNATYEQKVLYSNYIPSKYWKSLNFRFSPLEQQRYNKITKISIEDQNQFYKLIQTKKGLTISYVVAIGSYPTDNVAKMIAAEITKNALFNHHLKVKWFNTSVRKPNYNEERPDIVVLHNIINESPFNRWCDLRDWLLWSDDCFTLILMGGINPIYAMDNKLRFEADLYFWSNEPLRRIKAI